jgi:ADP-heptose:LPS heptosyltransferase
MYLGSDTGPMHLAAAVGTSCIGLFGTTRPEESGPYGQQHICLQARYQSGSARQRRRADNDAMREITAESVCDACDSLLSQAPTRYRHSDAA